jgi:hypothetical protein
MRIYNNFYVFLREGEYTIVSPTTVGEEKGSQDARVRQVRQWVARARWRWILEAVGSLGEMTAGSWVRRGRQWGAGPRWRSAMLGRNKFN